MASVSWLYPQDELIALRRQNAAAEAAAPVDSGIRHQQVCASAIRIEGDNPPWRPTQAFDDGTKVYIEFPRGIAQGEMPPLFVVGPDGRRRARQLSRRGSNYFIVDRLFAAAELRLGAAAPSAACASCAPTGESCGERSPVEHDPTILAAELRLRPERPRGHAALAQSARGLAAYRGFQISGALIWALQSRTAQAGQRHRTLQHRKQDHADGLATLPKDYAGLPATAPAPDRSPQLGPPLPGDLGRPILAAQRAGRSRRSTRAAARRPGNRGGAHQPAVRHDQCTQGAPCDPDHVAGRQRGARDAPQADANGRRSIPTRC